MLGDSQNMSHEHKDDSFQFSFTESSILSFVPREKWKEDSTTNRCFNCNSQFFFLLKRKHHCRKCGNIFCSNCSNFFLNTEEFGLKSAEKIARLCGYCYQGTQNYLSLMSREITLKKTLSQKTQVQQDTIDEIDSFNEDSIEEELTKVNSSGDFEERRKILFEKISAIIDLMSCKITCLMDLEVKSQLIKILVNALHLVHLDNINRKDFMDICHYIKIKRIKANGSVIPRLEYIQGIICTKNISDRKMKNCFERPKILIISSSIDLTNLNEKKENDVPVNMEVLLQNERKIMRKTVENILKFSPDVIFVGNSVNRIASEILKSQGVTLFVKVKTHLLRRIARMTRTKIIKSLKNIHKLTDRSITGICEKLYTKKILYEDNSKDPTLLYLEGCNSENGGTIAISGSSLEELTSIKKAIKILLRLGRHIVLEHEVVFIEKQMREELKNTYIAEELSCSLVEQLPLKRFEENNEKEALDIWNNDFKEGDFSNFLDRKMGISRFLKKDYIHYTKIHIVRALIENYTDISGNPAALLELNSKKYDVNESFSELCGLPSVNKIYYYSEDDITLGAFILNKIKNLFTRCEREGCNRPRNKHMALYYQGNRFVKISVEITGFIKAAALNSDGKYVYFEENKASENVRKSFSNSGKFDSLKPEPLLTSFRTFFACERCGMKLTEDKNLERPYLEYSFTRFLSHFFVGNEKKRNWKNEKILLNNDEVKCPHDTRKRVFQYGEFLINFSSGNLKPNSLEFIKFNTKQNLKNIQEASDQILNKKRELYLKKFKEIIINFINALKESIQKLDNNKISVFHEEFDIKSKDKIKSALETLLQKIQFFALSIETTLNSTLSNYLDLEFKRIKLAGQLSNFLEVFYQFIIKRPDTTAKIVSFNLLITNLSGEKNEQFLINTNKNIAPANQTQKEEENLPKIRPNSFFKRCLSSDKVSPREDEKLKTSTYIKKLSDVRFSSKPKPRPKQLVQNEKLGFFKKPSMQLRFNEKIDNIEDSFSENELENITETDDKPFKFEEIQLNLESSPMEEHDLEGISPPIQEKASEIPIKKLRSNNLEVIFKDLKSLNTGLDLSYFSVVTNEFAGILKFQKYRYIPIYENEPITTIAHALNSLNYLKDIYINGGFLKYEQEINDLKTSKENALNYKNLMKTHLEKPKIIEEPPSCFVFKTSFIKPFILNSELIKSMEDGSKIDNNSGYNTSELPNSSKIRKKKLIKTSIFIYYAKQFEALRMDDSILLSSFLTSLGCSSQWQENSGGKSKASFIKSFDNLYIFKQLEKKEFSMFFNYAHSYFDYIWKNNQKKRPSVLTKIYGLYELKIKDSRYYYICMENLFFGLDPFKEVKIYDLKGSENNRYCKKEKKNQTLLDTNYKIDQNGKPLPIKSIDKKYLNIAFENDTKFLKKHNLVDYSLLAIIDQEKRFVRMGIIDYLREYTWDKKVETVAKTISKGGATPTIVSPEDYKERFKKAMNKYFMEVSG